MLLIVMEDQEELYRSETHGVNLSGMEIFLMVQIHGEMKIERN